MKAPGKFDLEAHGASWYLWAEISNCFWPGVGKRSAGVDPVLAQMVAAKGIYCIAWRATGKASPDNPTVQYIGQTSNFKFRMGQFAWSAGLWGARARGHSAGWRWHDKKEEQLSVAFFPLRGSNIPKHMLNGYLHWYEALALEAHHQRCSALPFMNVPKNGIVVLD